jgi:5-methyltetrahydrofolate--homocysteine methyltransferase
VNPFLAALVDRVLVFDGATGTNLQLRDLTADDFGGPSLEGCNEVLVTTRPDVVADLHDSFFAVGVDAVETDTFGAFPIVLNEYAIPERSHELNLAAARIAREVASGYATPDRPRFVIGSIGPGTKLPSLGHTTFAELRDGYQLQCDALITGGVDVLLVETVYDLLQAKAALTGARRAMAQLGREVPLMVQVTMETTGRMLVGSEIGAALTTLAALRPDVIGLNCATGPREMTEHLRYLSRHASTFLSCLPNAGLPSVVDGHTHYDLTPIELADAHERFVTEFGVNIVGGCCGTSPAHLQAVVERVGGRAPTPREPVADPGCASIYSHVSFAQDLAYLSIGERTNANGSKAFRDAMLAEDWDACLRVASSQVKEGAHVLDLCVDYVGRDGRVDIEALTGRMATQVPLPLVIDSTEPPVMEAALQLIGGKPILNSANLEEGEDAGKRFDRVMSLARDYGAAVICLLIDEEGQARDVEWKMRVATRIYDLATERYGIPPTDLIFDALTFPLGTGQEDLRGDAMATMDAIRRIKSELPGAWTVLGLSNVSFGLKPAIRHVLNSVFLHECQQAGLDAAIVHAARIMPLNRIDERARDVCLDLIHDRRRDGYDPLTELLSLFEGVESSAVEKEDRSGWPVGERLSARIVDGDRDGIEADLDQAMAEGQAPLSIINDVLLAGMKTVGELFATGEMQLPFVLQSAETMKTAVAHLEPHMEKADSGGKGVVVLGTVRGDVHDIGKNLVDIILTNNGYEVHNLGIKVPVQDFLEAATSLKADAVGMSGLLVKSTLIMRENLEEFNARGLSDVPVLLGGAALTRTYVERDLREVYAGRLFYGRDAFEGLRTMDTLMAGKRAGNLDPAFGREISERAIPRRTAGADDDRPPLTDTARSDVPADNAVPTPPFLGPRHAKGISLDEIAEYVNETALFRNQWQFRPEGGESDESFKQRIRPIFREQLAAARAEGWLVPAVAWGYYAVNADGNDIVVWKDDDRRTEWLRFRFPRQRSDRRLCIADFVRSVDSGEADYAAFHVVTMGPVVSEHERSLFAANHYQDYVFTHGMGVEMTEALAEYWHRRIREDWGFADEDGPTLAGLFRQQYRGGRYSWGYPACPDLEDQAKLEDLLAMATIGVTLTEEFHLEPEQSTSAIICHHPDAKYFIAR